MPFRRGQGRSLRLGWVSGRQLFAPCAPLGSQVRQMLLEHVFTYTPPPTQIPVTWLSQPFDLRLEPYIAKAAVSQTGGGTAYSRWDAGITKYGPSTFTANLDTACSADPQALADFATTYRQAPRMTSPRLQINLLYRTESERRRVLGVKIDNRIQITGVPAEYPAGGASLVVTGIRRRIGVREAMVEWTLDPVLGQGGNLASSVAAGTPGPWFRADVSKADTGSDVLAF